MADDEEGQAEDKLKQSKPHKIQGKTKTEKPSDPKNVSPALVKKSKDEKIAKERLTAPNGGSVAANSRMKQPLKSRSLNERQANGSQHPGKPDAAFSEGNRYVRLLLEKPKLKPLKKEPPNKAEGDTELSPTAADDKAHKIGTLPNYGFSFKCGERTEKRKEFYYKLEEKIHAMEVEKSNFQAKQDGAYARTRDLEDNNNLLITKETQEAEIKMFRKILNFKATPMPSFYQEPPPPTLELKKIPTTRAKSPKLGRIKSSSTSEIDGNSNNVHQSGRLSLDEKASQRISAEEKATESEATTEGKKASTKETNEENTTSSDLTNEELSPVQQPEAVSTADSGGSRPEKDRGPMIGEQGQLGLE
ncbi:enolase-phosphatase E1-like isoform X2 [Hibiscus syriacus]|uniref:Enolase-phosphatase E1-like isoform X2 n=1 Tax=Hibiscus syriacus TaxID=106335 RepID=A0A6A2XKN3_HIBSY|nr:enolase-phosphatase E1-like isoform X2 [Hibiscus syriacus]